jgi:hypothetical protein
VCVLDTQAPTDTVSETISEATFLLTELRYTLGQMHVQIGDLDEETRKTAKCGDRSAADILAEMMRSEDAYQERYAQILGIDASKLKPAEEVVPLPLSEEVDEESQEQNDFEHNRAQTIALLDQAGDSWPAELLDLVRQHVAEDRRHTTSLAECRKHLYDTDSRPDNDEPLTAAQDLRRESSSPAGSARPESTGG